MNEQERLNRIAVALREANKLVEEGSEAHGYIAEALAYADGDLSSFDFDGEVWGSGDDTDLQILEMYHKDGMKETEIAKSLGISLLVVHEVLAAFDWTEEDKT